MFKSIRSKLIVFSLALIIITMVPVIIAVNILINRSVYNSYQTNVASQVNVIEQIIEVFYDELDRNIDYFANHHLIRSANGTITTYMDENKVGVMRTPSSNGGIEQSIYEEFSNYAQTHPGTLYVYVATRDGGYVQWPETVNKKSFDPRKRPWYDTGMAGNGKIVRTDPYVSLLTGAIINSNLRTFKNKAGQIYGVVGIDVSSDKLADIMGGVKIGRTGYAMMVHKTGLVLADPHNKENNLKNVKDLGIEKMESVLEKEKTNFETMIDGVKYCVKSFPSENTDWVMVILMKKAEFSEMANSIRNTIFMITLLAIIVIAGMTYALSRRLIKPINLMVKGLKDIAQGEGDLTMRLASNGKDEIGDMARLFNIFVEKLQSFIKSIANDSGELDTSSNSLLSIAGEVSQSSENMSKTANSVDAAAEKMSSNMNSVAAAVEQSATNISMISAAAEEMTSTIDEIAKNTALTKVTSNNAVQRTRTASEKINELSSSAQQIGNVVETINDISEQTNLLALNATIEAARAGEAGKGFGVVAGEIKELARQTAEATLKIQGQIHAIQSSTRETVVEIEEVIGGITSVNGMIDNVASAVEEQSVTTREIALNVNQAAEGIQEVTENVTLSSSVATDIARDISDVSAAANAMSKNSSSINNSATDLSKLSGKLMDTLNVFKV